jgi:hypothetical protein
MDLEGLKKWPLAAKFGNEIIEIYKSLEDLYSQAGIAPGSPVFVKHKNIFGQDYIVVYD